MTLSVRPLVVDDLLGVLRIERESFSAPWSLAMLIHEIAVEGVIALALEEEGAITGYAFCSPHADDWHLVSIAVDPSRRRSGGARLMLLEILNRLGDESRITLEVRPSNVAAIGLYEQHGFLFAGARPAYYPDSGEDALIMWRTPATLSGRLDDVPNAEPQRK